MIANIPDMASLPNIVAAAFACSASVRVENELLRISMISLRDFIEPSLFMTSIPSSSILAATRA